MRLLLAAGAKVNARDNRDSTPLHKAVRASRSKVEAVRLLLAAGADIQAKQDVSEEPHSGKTPLCSAYEERQYYNNEESPESEAAFEVVKVLVKHSGKDLKDLVDGCSLLSWAAARADMRTEGLLLNAGVNPDMMGIDGTALHEAARNGSLDIVK